MQPLSFHDHLQNLPQADKWALKDCYFPDSCYSLAMAMQLLSGVKEPPTSKKPIVLDGHNEDELRYLWTALMVIGEQKGMKFNDDAIRVITPCFSPANEKGTFSRYSGSSCYHQCFKNSKALHNVTKLIKDLVIDKNPDSRIAKQLKESSKNITALFKKEMKDLERLKIESEENNEQMGNPPVLK